MGWHAPVRFPESAFCSLLRLNYYSITAYPTRRAPIVWRTLSSGRGANELGLSALDGAIRSAACFSPTFKHGKYAQARTASDKVAYQVGKSQLRFGLS
jgi:hypothetical protein